MIEQCLSNKNESATVSFFQNFLELNKAWLSMIRENISRSMNY